MNAMYVFAYGGPVGRILVDDDGLYRAYDLHWSPIDGPRSTERRARHAIGQHALLSIYGTAVEALRAELRRGIIALDQDPANENRLVRCTPDDIRWLSQELLAGGWNKSDLAVLIAKWRRLRGEDTP